jgi:hypothetical protein
MALDSFCFWFYHSGSWRVSVFYMDCYVWIWTKLQEAAGENFFVRFQLAGDINLKKNALLYLTPNFNYAWSIVFWVSVRQLLHFQTSCLK